MQIGLAVTVSHFVAIPVDNCSINPARSFGVSAVSGNWNDHLVFWFGPYLGATAAALVYTYVLEPQIEDHPLPPQTSSDDTNDDMHARVVSTFKEAPQQPQQLNKAPQAEAVPVELKVNDQSSEWN